MKGRQVTIKDIAKELHISPSTVSRALKDHPDINPQTKKKIQDLASKLKYKPNQIALNLLQQESKIIGVIIPEIIHYFFSTLISGIEKVANENGYHIIIVQSNESYHKEADNIQALISSNIDGFIISMAKTTLNYDHFKNVESIGIPMVFTDRSCNEVKADQVLIDDFTGAYNATKHLIENGSQNLIHLAGPQTLDIGIKRKNGFIQALKDHNIKIRDYSIQLCDNYEHALSLVPKIYSKYNNVDGIFAVNDLTAIGAIKAIKSINKKVPTDVKVCGFTNSTVSYVCDPELTTIDQKGFEMGQKAAQMLLKRIQSSEEYEPLTEYVETDLVIRESSLKI